jgi:hypothetical protein
MERELHKETLMQAQPQKKLIHEGQYIAEVEVQLIESEDTWAPYLSVEDAQKLDDVRLALRRGDIQSALRLAKIYQLTPVNAA